jgi:hypothetical protein
VYKRDSISLFSVTLNIKGHRSSGSIVSMGWTIGIRSPTGAQDFSSSPYIQTSSGAHPASYPMGTRGPFPRDKHGWGITLTTNPHLVPKLSMSRSYNSSPPCASMVCNGTTLLYFTLLYLKYQTMVGLNVKLNPSAEVYKIGSRFIQIIVPCNF